MPKPKPLSNVIFTSIVVALAILTYSNSFDGSFVWDDRAAIVDNDDVQGVTSIRSLLVHDFWGTDIRSHTSHKSYRPLTTLSFRIDHSVHGYKAYGYHLTSVLVYCLTCIAFFYTCCQWMRLKSAKVATLLFTVHPVHVEAVASLVGRADNMCGLFFLLSMIFYTFGIRAPSRTTASLYTAASVLMGVLSSLSKEVGLTVFAVLIVIEILHAVAISLGDSKYLEVANMKVAKALSLDSGVLVNRSLYVIFGIARDAALIVLKDWHSVIRVLVSFTSIIVFFAFRSWLHGQHTVYPWTVLENHVHSIPSFQTRLLSYAQSHSWYALKLFYPKYLCFDYGYSCLPVIESLTDSRNLLPVALYTALFVAIYSALVSINASRLLGFACLLLPLLPALNILVPVGTLLAERLLFVPSIGFCMVAGELLTEDLDHVWKYLRSALLSFIPKEFEKTRLHVGKALLLPLLYYCVLRCRSRNEDWGSEQQIYSTALSVCPNSIKALANHAVFVAKNGNHRGSQDSALRALDLYPKHAIAAGNAGLASSKLGEFVRATALLEYSFFTDGRNVKIPAYMSENFNSWSRSLGVRSRLGIKMSELSMEMLTVQDNFSIQTPSSLASAALNAFEMGDFQSSVTLQTAAISKSLAAKNKRGESGDVPIEDDIKLCFAYNKLAEAQNALGDKASAVASMEEGLRIDALCEPIVVNLAAFYRELGLASRAKEKLSASVKVLEPSCSAVLLNNYGSILLELGEYVEALSYFEKALDRLSLLNSHDIIKQGGKINVVGADGASQVIQNNIAKARAALNPT